MSLDLITLLVWGDIIMIFYLTDAAIIAGGFNNLSTSGSLGSAIAGGGFRHHF